MLHWFCRLPRGAKPVQFGNQKRQAVTSLLIIASKFTHETKKADRVISHHHSWKQHCIYLASEIQNKNNKIFLCKIHMHAHDWYRNTYTKFISVNRSVNIVTIFAHKLNFFLMPQNIFTYSSKTSHSCSVLRS